VLGISVSLDNARNARTFTAFISHLYCTSYCRQMECRSTVRRYTFLLSQGTNVYSSYAFPPTQDPVVQSVEHGFPLIPGRDSTPCVASALRDRTGLETRVGARAPQKHSSDGWRRTYIGFERSYRGITGITLGPRHTSQGSRYIGISLTIASTSTREKQKKVRGFLELPDRLG
jgi:hypothetical protein